MCGSCGGHSRCAGHKTAWALVIIGGLNWGLIGAFGYNLVNNLLGTLPTVERVVYVLVGLAAVMLIVGCRCKVCMAACGSCKTDKPEMKS